VRFFLTWLYKMRWWFLIVAAVVLAYTIGAPKNFALLDWVKGAFDK
jgi:hypothetical protein